MHAHHIYTNTNKNLRSFIKLSTFWKIARKKTQIRACWEASRYQDSERHYSILLELPQEDTALVRDEGINSREVALQAPFLASKAA